MARKKKRVKVEVVDLAIMQPSELNALKAVVDEFMNRYKSLQGEIETLKEDEKNLIEEYEEKLDVRTLKAAMRTVQIQRGVVHRSTYDAFLEILNRDSDHDLV